MLESLRRYENQLGTVGAVLAVVMFTSLVEVAWSNYQDKSVIWIQPTISIINSMVWCLYAVAKTDRFAAGQCRRYLLCGINYFCYLCLTSFIFSVYRATFMDIKIFTTGGTIDKIYFDQKSAYQVGEPAVDEVLKESNVTVSYQCETILHKDSLDMTEDDRQTIYDAVAADRHRQVIITHGTDTMIQTAQKLQPLTRDKVIVLTGSMMPAKFKASDAVFNIGCAMIAVQTLPPGVYIAMNGQIFDPARTRKNVGLNRFEPIA